MNGAKVLRHVISERGPAGSEFEARHVLGIAAFLPGSALSDGTSSCFPLSLSRSARRPCKPRALCDREIIVLPASKTNDFDTSRVVALFDQHNGRVSDERAAAAFYFAERKPQVRVIPAGTTHGPPRKLAKGAALLRSR